MKIHRGPQINIVSGLQRSPKTQRKTAVTKPRELGKDKVELSSRSRDVHRLAELAKLVPEVRLEKVNAIKRQIQAGNYDVPPESVARSIIDFHKTLESGDE